MTHIPIIEERCCLPLMIALCACTHSFVRNKCFLVSEKLKKLSLGFERRYKICA